MMSDILVITTGMMLGLLGSLHCLGMCGGIAGLLHATGAGAEAGSTRQRRWRMSLIYNSGRIVSYMIAGALAAQLGVSLLGLLGEQVSRAVAQMTGGLFMILLGLYLAGWWNALAPLERIGLTVWQYISPLTRHLLPIDRYSRAFAAGILWGWLPCGLVYSALVLVIASGDVLTGIATMGAFGLGTLPLVLMLSLLGGEKSILQGSWIRKAAGTVIIIFGAVLFSGLATARNAGHL